MDGISAPVSTQRLITWWQSSRLPHQPSNCVCTQGGVCGSIESLCDQIAKRYSVSRSTLFRRIQAGTLTMAEADQIACALGTTAYRIWPGFDRAPVTASLSALSQPGTARRSTLF